MERLCDLVGGQMSEFYESIGPDHNLGVRLPALGHDYFLPSKVEDYNPEVVILHGHLENGGQSRVVFDKASFPLILVAIPKAQDQPKRPFGYGSYRDAIAKE